MHHDLIKNLFKYLVKSHGDRLWMLPSLFTRLSFIDPISLISEIVLSVISRIVVLKLNVVWATKKVSPFLMLTKDIY